MRVVITGATGNVGTSLVRVLAEEPAVDSVLGVARRLPGWEVAKADWVVADVATSDLAPLFRGADVVVHLAWLIQPSRDVHAMRGVNVVGSERVFRAAADAGVKALIHGSSVGTYSPGPKDRTVDEQWPTDGVATSFYSRHKAEVERRLDRFEAEFPDRPWTPPPWRTCSGPGGCGSPTGSATEQDSTPRRSHPRQVAGCAGASSAPALERPRAEVSRCGRAPRTWCGPLPPRRSRPLRDRARRVLGGTRHGG